MGRQKDVLVPLAPTAASIYIGIKCSSCMFHLYCSLIITICGVNYFLGPLIGVFSIERVKRLLKVMAPLDFRFLAFLGSICSTLRWVSKKRGSL